MFTPRTFPEILYDMIAYVQVHTPVSDFNPGSVIRTILEASALEDDEQYFQMVQLLDMFSILTSTKTDLDRRMADYNLFRLPAAFAFGKVKIADNNVKTSQIAVDAVAGATLIRVFDSTPFPSTGFPYTIRLGEGTPNVQDVDVSANNTSAAELTVAALTDPANIGDSVTLVTGAPTRLVGAGTGVEAPTTVLSPTKKYATREPATILPGNILSNPVSIQALTPGSINNAGARAVTRFTGGAPFTGASVVNDNTIEGGLEIESDDSFQRRGLAQLQSLSRGTPLALKTGAIGVTDPETGQRVLSANIVEDFVDDVVRVYIDDGTGLDPDTRVTGGSTLLASATLGDGTITLEDGTDFPSSGTILIEDGNDSELVDYVTKIGDLLNLSPALTANHAAGTIVNLVDVVTLSAEANQRRFRLTNLPIVVSSDRIYVKPPAGDWTLLINGTDYILNNGTGEFQIIDTNGVSAGTQIVAGYTYYTNLIALVQKILEGDPDDPQTFPGIKAAGIILQVLEPSPVYISVHASISAEEGFVEADLKAPVRRAIEDYINSRKIGEDVIVSKMIDAAHNVLGLRDIDIVTPVSNQIILEYQLAIAQNDSGVSLVEIT